MNRYAKTATEMSIDQIAAKEGYWTQHISFGQLENSACVLPLAWEQLAQADPELAQVAADLQDRGTDVFIPVNGIRGVYINVRPPVSISSDEQDRILDESSRELGFNSFADYLASTEG